jgi:hypothetical protein
MAAKVVEETNIGIYVWEMPDGRWVGDDQGHFMYIKAKKGDQRRINQLRDAARSYGVTEGKPHFLAGHRPVTDEEYEEQVERLHEGYQPDPYDIPTMIQEYKHGRTPE